MELSQSSGVRGQRAVETSVQNWNANVLCSAAVVLSVSISWRHEHGRVGCCAHIMITCFGVTHTAVLHQRHWSKQREQNAKQASTSPAGFFHFLSLRR